MNYDTCFLFCYQVYMGDVVAKGDLESTGILFFKFGFFLYILKYILDFYGATNDKDKNEVKILDKLTKHIAAFGSLLADFYTLL